jgi:hypothetical protein
LAGDNENIQINQVGGFSSPISQPAECDFIGSAATITVRFSPHFSHLNVRLSQPSGSRSADTKGIRSWQRGHRGRSIAMREDWGLVMMHPISGGDKHDQQGRLGRPFKYLNRLVPKSNEKWNRPLLFFWSWAERLMPL